MLVAAPRCHPGDRAATECAQPGRRLCGGDGLGSEHAARAAQWDAEGAATGDQNHEQRCPERRRGDERTENFGGGGDQAEFDEEGHKREAERRGEEVKRSQGERADPGHADPLSHPVGDERDDNDVNEDIEARGDRLVLSERAVVRHHQVDDLDHANGDESRECEEPPLTLAGAARRVAEGGNPTAREERRDHGDRVFEVVELPEVEHRNTDPQDHGEAGAQPPGRAKRGDREDERGERPARGPHVPRLRKCDRPVPTTRGDEHEDSGRPEHAHEVSGDEQAGRAQRVEAPLGPPEAANDERQQREIDEWVVHEER